MARTTALASGRGGGAFRPDRSRPQTLRPPPALGRPRAVLSCLPWAWATCLEYGTPFYSIPAILNTTFPGLSTITTRETPSPRSFTRIENLPEIVRVKIKSLLIIAVYSTMIVGLPIVLGFWRGLGRGEGSGRGTDLLVATIFARLRSGDAQEHRRRDAGRAARALLPAGLCAGAAAGGRGRPGLAGLACGSTAASFRGSPSPIVRSSGPTRPGPTTPRGSSSPISSTGPPCAGRRVDPGQSRAGPARGADHDLVPLGAARHVRSDHRSSCREIYDPRRIEEVIRQYQVTHILWGSFEPPPYFEINPESWSPELEKLERRSA